MTRRMWLASASIAVVAGLAPPAASGSASDDLVAAEAAAFAEADANGDGKLSPAEFANFGVLLRQKVDALRFARLDADGDGMLSQDEVAAGRPGGGGFPPPPF